MPKQQKTKANPHAAPVETAAKPGPGGKLGILATLLRRADGATLAQLTEATGWQVHSVRGALAGALRKKHGLIITSEKVDGARVYRAIVGASA